MSALGYIEMSAFGPRKLSGRRLSGAGGCDGCNVWTDTGLREALGMSRHSTGQGDGQETDACTLLVYVDDATSRLMMLHFTQTESTFTLGPLNRRLVGTTALASAFDKALSCY